MLGELKAIDGLIFKSYRRNGISPRPRARSGDDLLAEYHDKQSNKSDLFAIDKEGVDIREVVVMLKLGKGI